MMRCDQRQNLGEHGRQKAMTAGVLVGGVALAWALLCAQLGLTSQLGWLVALPAAASAYLLISGSLGICAFHGMRGQRGADHGREAVLDRDARQQLRLRALLAVSASLVIAAAFTAALVAGSP